MDGPKPGFVVLRLWFPALVAGSAVLLLVTIASYALVGQPIANLLFWIGLGGEQNIGAWWSGMLLVLAAFLTFDGYFDSAKPLRERRGWLALGFALLLLSFDEIASLHEYLSDLGLRYLAVLGVVGVALASYGMERLFRSGVRTRTLWSLLLAFGLLASVPIHENLQHRLQWNSELVYGLRAFLEEGTEIAAMLLFVQIGRANSTSLWRSSQDVLVVLVRRRQLISLAALFLWPMLVAAAFVLSRPGGSADWLAATLFLACALLVARAGALRGTLDSRELLLLLFYVAASAAANGVSFRWDPVVFGTAMSVRGIVFAGLMLGATVLLEANGRPVRASRASLIVATVAASAIAWPSSLLLWSGLPPMLALVLFGIESKVAARGTTPLAVPPLRVPVA